MPSSVPQLTSMRFVQPCPNNFYSAFPTGATYCAACPPGTYSPSRSPSYSSCVPHTGETSLASWYICAAFAAAEGWPRALLMWARSPVSARTSLQHRLCTGHCAPRPTPAAWAETSFTQLTNGPCKFILQAERNVVLYGGSTPLWASNTRELRRRAFRPTTRIGHCSAACGLPHSGHASQP